MDERDLRCPGCTGFDKAVSSSCIFKDLKQEGKKDTVKCSSCGKEIDTGRLKPVKDSRENPVCPECGQKIII